ncbi:complement factor H isoform X7 [Oncorhynchus kisutch]|uniref:Complement factor H like 1 n=1 Tax=Oncorhynchus kisutch TaxID=8019 RepID=A0A8C7IZK3_ONCKI|nr:complement factor H-like isoform X7 [Oncorhynchus kisutch]
MRLITLGFVFALWLCTLSFVKGQAKSCGHPGDTPNGDFHLSILDDFVFGAQVLYQCRKGYQMVTRSRHRTCVEQGWDSALPICEALKCPVIQANDNVVVIGNSEDATYGNVIQFECQSNHMVLKGSSEIDCNDKGEWSSTVPTCEVIKCYAPDIANGAVSGPPKEDYDEDDTLRYSCDTKYVKSQERVPKCTKMVNSANWSPTPACEEVRCKLSFPPTRGTSYTPADRNMFLPDERVTVTCDSGFWNFFSSHTENTITCKEDGKWSSSTTDCERITCGDPHDPLVISPSRWQRGQLRGTQHYNCRTGYKNTNARGVATCTSDGSWTPEPLCEEITCDKPDILNAVIKDPKTIYKFNDLLTYECNYELLDSTTRPTATCTTNGWTKTLGCKEIEGACINPTVMNGFIVQSNVRNVDPRNSKIYSSCNVGFKPSTGGWWGEATCTEGTWSGILKCIDQSQCGRIPVIPNTREVPHSEVYNNEQTVTIDCKVGYTSETKTIKCKDGEWQTPLPACRPQGVQCDPPPKVENAIVNIPYQNKYREGFEVNYECRKSIEIEGHKKLTCENGSWTTPPPTCKQYCGKPEGTGKQIWIIDKVLKRYKNGNQIDYTCISPYKGPGGKATCKNGEWHMPFECNASCPDPPPITNGDLTKQERDVDGVITEVSYQCNRQFTLSSTGSIRCLNGKWQSPPKCLRSCEISTFAAEYNLQNLPEKNYTAHGEKRTIHCKKGYYHKYKIILPNIEKIEVKCDDGELQYGEHIPICSHRYS